MTDTIERVTLLHGHTDAESAYLVPDYPFGFRLRCQIRYWIETATKGAKKGELRFVSQTTNPKVEGTVWNKPKASTYYSLAVMYLDENEHVKHAGISFWHYPADDARWRRMGIVDQLTAEQRKVYDFLLAASEKINPTTWTEWTDHITALAEYIRETGAEPEIVNGTWRDVNDRVRYISDPAVYMAEAHARLS
jgi:hypothetical protein